MEQIYLIEADLDEIYLSNKKGFTKNDHYDGDIGKMINEWTSN